MSPDSKNAETGPVSAPNKIGLALSGGGFRATLFHLGVVRCLYDNRLLERVSCLTSVSGGSILAAHLSLKWNEWTSDNIADYEKVEDEVRAFTRLDVRNRVIRRWPLAFFHRWTSPVADGTLTSVLSKFYHRLYAKCRLRDLRVRTDFLASNLTVPEAESWFSNDGFHYVRPGVPTRGEGELVRGKVPCDGLPVAAAVAASSAFPGLFNAVRADGRLLKCGPKDLSPLPQYLSDGGVRDNLGVEHLRQLANDEGLGAILLSDAGAAVEWSETDFARWRTKTLLRCFDVSLASRPSRPSLPDIPTLITKKFSIRDVEPSVGKRLSRDELLQLAKIRTDLDRFCEFEEWCLISHGYCVAEAQLRNLASEPRRDSFRPWQENGVSIPRDVSGTLEKSSRRLSGLTKLVRIIFDPGDWMLCIAYLVALVLIFWIAIPMGAFYSEKSFHWVASRFLPEPSDSALRFKPAKVLAGNVALSRQVARPAKDTLDYASNNLSRLTGANQELRVYEQIKVCGGFRPVRRKVVFLDAENSDVNAFARDGKAYLVKQQSDDSEFGIRELSLPKEANGKLTGFVELPMAEPGEFLVFLLVLEPKVAETKLPTVFFEMRLR